jgi:hypothetical protein
MVVENLPLDGRNFANLMGLTDGATPAQTQIAGQMALSEVRGATGYSVNGLRMEENHILLDGISDVAFVLAKQISSFLFGVTACDPLVRRCKTMVEMRPELRR